MLTGDQQETAVSIDVSWISPNSLMSLIILLNCLNEMGKSESLFNGTQNVLNDASDFITIFSFVDLRIILYSLFHHLQAHTTPL